MRYGSIGRTTVFKIEAKSQSFAVFIILLICLSKDAVAGRGTGVGTGDEFGDGEAAGSSRQFIVFERGHKRAVVVDLVYYVVGVNLLAVRLASEKIA